MCLWGLVISQHRCAKKFGYSSTNCWGRQSTCCSLYIEFDLMMSFFLSDTLSSISQASHPRLSRVSHANLRMSS